MFLFVNLNQKPTHEFIMNSFRPKMPPFGVAYISAVLKQKGIDCVLHDDNLHEFTDAQFKELFLKYKGNLHAVGLTSVSTTLRQLSRLARISKEMLPDVPVIVGGPHARLLPEDIMEYPEVDIVFTSEAELAITDYAEGTALSEIEGIMYRDNGRIAENPMVNVIENLDEIPFPDYTLFNIADYHTTKGISKRHPNSYIINSRGCPYRCTFCSSKSLNPTPKKKIRYRSAANSIAEIEMLVNKYNVHELFFSDDMFTGNRDLVFGICEGIIHAGLDVIWVCQTHVNNIDQEKLKIMKRAGCHQICFGVESGDVNIQKEIRKNLDLQKVIETVRMTQQVGIDARASFMFGNQYETADTMQRTIDFAKKLSPDFASFNIATPYPGTYFREWAIDNNYLNDTRYEALDSTAYILRTPDLPAGTVERYCNKAFRSFYYSPRYILRRLRGIRDIEDLARFAKSFCYAVKSIPSVVRGLFFKKQTT